MANTNPMPREGTPTERQWLAEVLAYTEALALEEHRHLGRTLNYLAFQVGAIRAFARRGSPAGVAEATGVVRP